VPTSFVIPDYHTNDVLDTLDLLAEAGFECMDWQAFLLEAWMGVAPNGRWSAPIVGNETSRQQGKTRCIQGRSATEMLFYDGTVIYTAQLQKTSTETFEEMATLMDTRALRKFLAPNGIRTALGREEIRLKSGPKMKFLARTRNGGNGQHGSLLIFDEAQYLDAQSQGSFLGAISACRTRRGPQTIYNGNAPEEDDNSAVYERIRNDALGGRTKRTAWTEWSCGTSKQPPETSDRKLWVRTNPSWGILLDPETVEAEHESLETVQFAHQRLGWFLQREDVDKLFGVEEWDALRVDGAPGSWDKLAYGVRFRPDGASVSLSVCVLVGDVAHVEFIREEPMSAGIGWLVEWLSASRRKREAAAIAIDGKADATDLQTQLTKRKVPKAAILVAKPADAVAAAGMLLNAVHDGTLTHTDDKALAESVLGATRRKIGDGFGFGGDCPQRVDSVALAHWAARTTKRNPRRKGRVGC
jgi:phage terminase large subunit-like protein